MKNKEVTEYINKQSKEVQKILKKMRSTIQKAAPDANEAMGYGVPAFKLNGFLVYFAGFKKHVGLYPNGNSAMKKFKKELEEYDIGKGTIRFPLDEPIPYHLITKIVKFRVIENKSK